MRLPKSEKQPEHPGRRQRPIINWIRLKNANNHPFHDWLGKNIYVRAQSASNILNVLRSEYTEKPQSGIDCGVDDGFRVEGAVAGREDDLQRPQSVRFMYGKVRSQSNVKGPVGLLRPSWRGLRGEHPWYCVPWLGGGWEEGGRRTLDDERMRRKGPNGVLESQRAFSV